MFGYPSKQLDDKKSDLETIPRGWCIKFATGLNVRFTTICNHFFANYIKIFHKTEVQTVVLRCCMGLYLNWFKSYVTNTKKHVKTQKMQKVEKTLHK